MLPATYKSAIPEDLKAQKRWLFTGANKIPCKADGGHADYTNPDLWMEYPKVIPPKFAGVTYVLAKDSGIVFIDLDGVRDPITGIVAEWADDLITELNTYTELSRSGRGYHLLVRGSIPANYNPKRPEGSQGLQGFEYYDTNKPVAMTGFLDDRYCLCSPQIETRDLSGLVQRVLHGDLHWKQLNRPPSRFHWETLATEDDILKAQGESLEYIVDEIIPAQRITMLYGQEKSGKSIVALDLCKHIANGVRWLNRDAKQTPCLYIDLEDGILGSYIGWIKNVGTEKIRFATIRMDGGIPTLDDAGLLDICAKNKPVIVLDSLHKLFTREKERKGGSAFTSSDYEPVLEKIRQLCVHGATVILIHHATKADNEQYRDSSAIGANVDFMFAVVGDDPDGNGVKRIHLKGQPSRGAQPPTINILAFPHIIEKGHLCVDGEQEERATTAKQIVAEIRANGPAMNRTKLCSRIHGRRATVLAAIAEAIKLGYLHEGETGALDVGQTPVLSPVPARVPMEPEIPGTDDGTDPF